MIDQVFKAVVFSLSKDLPFQSTTIEHEALTALLKLLVQLPQHLNQPKYSTQWVIQVVSRLIHSVTK
jgi:hypothetical protein